MTISRGSPFPSPPRSCIGGLSTIPRPRTFLSDYAVWAMSKFARFSAFQNYEFMSPGPALRRGFEFCSQTSRIVFSILLDNGFRPLIMTHEQHTVEVNGTVIDSDYGVFIPFNLKELKDKPYLAPFLLRQFSHRADAQESICRRLHSAFQDRGAGIRDSVPEVADSSRLDRSCHPPRYALAEAYASQLGTNERGNHEGWTAAITGLHQQARQRAPDIGGTPSWPPRAASHCLRRTARMPGPASNL